MRRERLLSYRFGRTAKFSLPLVPRAQLPYARLVGDDDDNNDDDDGDGDDDDDDDSDGDLNTVTHLVTRLLLIKVRSCNRNTGFAWTNLKKVKCIAHTLAA